MGGKGQRRREKNYREAHGGGSNRLPPPPDRAQLDALPSKLRKLITFSKGFLKVSKENEQKSLNGDDALSGKDKKRLKSETAVAQVRSDDPLPDVESGDELVNNSTDEKKKKKRKRKLAKDLRFETLEKLGASKRRQRKKEYLEARKKKHKKAKSEDELLGFPGREKIRFGDVVDAPPKLTAFPKAFSAHNASQERIRLRAIEAYRNRKGWASRPGVQLPSPITEL